MDPMARMSEITGAKWEERQSKSGPLMVSPLLKRAACADEARRLNQLAGKDGLFKVVASHTKGMFRVCAVRSSVTDDHLNKLAQYAAKSVKGHSRLASKRSIDPRPLSNEEKRELINRSPKAIELGIGLSSDGTKTVSRIEDQEDGGVILEIENEYQSMDEEKETYKLTREQFEQLLKKAGG
ncbi:MAG: hypothetical protein KDK78_07980 [Chlamydiia bacterium]|nr:hypothetical protein [Chlamydiia bacterium]